MTLADRIDRAVSHLGAAKAYAVSPRYVVEAVAGINNALAVLEDARGRAEALERECVDLRREVSVYREVNRAS